VINKEIVRKTASAVRLLAISSRLDERALANQFKRWREAIEDRKSKLLRKYCVLWMNKTRVGYQ
jgi:hypothetical protein